MCRGGTEQCAAAPSPRASGRLGALHSSPALDVRLPTALQVLQGQGRCALGCVPSLLFANSFLFSLSRPAGASHGRNIKNLATLKGGNLSLLLNAVLLLRFPRTESNDAYSVTISIFKKNTTLGSSSVVLCTRTQFRHARRGREPKPSDPAGRGVPGRAPQAVSILT